MYLNWWHKFRNWFNWTQESKKPLLESREARILDKKYPEPNPQSGSIPLPDLDMTYEEWENLRKKFEQRSRGSAD